VPTVYRIRHLPSGLYFCPSRSIKVRLEGDSPILQSIGRYIKSNLSDKGKVYVRRPSIKQIGDHYYTHHGVNHVDDLDRGILGRYRLLPVDPDEWAIEEFI